MSVSGGCPVRGVPGQEVGGEGIRAARGYREVGQGKQERGNARSPGAEAGEGPQQEKLLLCQGGVTHLSGGCPDSTPCVRGVPCQGGAWEAEDAMLLSLGLPRARVEAEELGDFIHTASW